MSRLDELPPDQRAALSLLLLQHKSYAEVAALLGIAERAVHDRAQAAIVVLAPRQSARADTREPPGNRRLPARPAAGRRRASAHARAAEQLGAGARVGDADRRRAAGADGGLEPAGHPSRPRRQRRRRRRCDGRSTARRRSVLRLRLPAGAPRRRRPPRRASQRSSRVGGAVLLAVLVVAIAVAVVLLTGGSSSKKPTATTTGQTASTVSKTGPTIEDQIVLKPAKPGIKSVGAAYILAEGSKRAFFIDARNLPLGQGLLLRDLAVQLAHELRPRHEELGRQLQTPPRRHLAAADQRR